MPQYQEHDDITKRNIETIINFVQTHHRYGEDPSYSENAAIDFEMLSAEMIDAIASKLKEG